jgi:hypothetical protein
MLFEMRFSIFNPTKQPLKLITASANSDISFQLGEISESKDCISSWHVKTAKQDAIPDRSPSHESLLEEFQWEGIVLTVSKIQCDRRKLTEWKKIPYV